MTEDLKFFEVVGLILHAVWSFFAKLLLPGIVAFSIIGAVAFALFTLAMMIGYLLGFVDIQPDKKKNEKENEKEKDQADSSDAAGAATTSAIDMSDKKTRIEMEIKLLGDLLQAKQEQLKNLQNAA